MVVGVTCFIIRLDVILARHRVLTGAFYDDQRSYWVTFTAVADDVL